MDPISDLLVRIKNAGYAGKMNVTAPFSRMKLSIAQLLEQKGFVGSVETKGKNPSSKYLTVHLLYEADGSPRIRDAKRVSKPSRRLYEKANKLKPHRQGFGIAVLSTPKGIMADMDAKKIKVGGEVLFTIW